MSFGWPSHATESPCSALLWWLGKTRQVTTVTHVICVTTRDLTGYPKGHRRGLAACALPMPFPFSSDHHHHHSLVMSTSRPARVEDTYEAQNDSRLDDLHAKLRTLRGASLLLSRVPNAGADADSVSSRSPQTFTTTLSVRTTCWTKP